MTFLTTFEYLNPQIAHYKNAIERLDIEIESRRNDLQNYRENIKHIEPLREYEGILEDEFKALITGRIGECSEANTIVHHLKSKIESILISVDSTIASYENSIERNIRDKIEYIEYLNRLSKVPTIFDINVIRQQLENVDSTEENSVVMWQDDNNHAYVSWVRRAGWAEVKNHSFDRPWFHAPIKIEVPECRIYVNLQTKNVSIKNLFGGTEGMYGYGHPTVLKVHPHIMSDDTPCFGDFAGAVTEALSENDWNTAATMIDLFLRQVNDQDAAGKQWVEYFKSKCGVTRSTVELCRTNEESEDIWSHFFFENGRWIVKKSQRPLEYVPIENTSNTTSDDTSGTTVPFVSIAV